MDPKGSYVALSPAVYSDNKAMVIAATLLLAQAQTVTLKTDAVTVRALLPELSKVTGLTLMPSKDIEWEVVYLRVKDVPASELLQKVADATFGMWEKANDGRLILKVNPTHAAKARETAKKALIEELTEAFKKMGTRKELSPDDRALYLIAQRIGISALSSIAPEARVVFSTSPTQTQRPINIDPNLAQGLVLEHNKRAELSKASTENQSDEEMKMLEGMIPPELLKMAKQMEESMRPKRIEGVPAKINVAFANNYGSISATLKMFDTQGRVLTEIATDISSASYDEKEETKEEEDEKKDPDKSPVIKLSKESTAILALGVGGREEAQNARSDRMKEIRGRLGKIRESDPFLAAFTEVLNGYAQHVEGNLVFNVPDILSYGLRSGQATVKTLDQLIATKTDGSWKVNAAVPVERVNRDVLAELIDMLAKGPSLTIDQRAWLATNQDSLGGQYNPLVMSVFTVFAMNAFTWRSQELLKLYGMLSAGQRQAARSPSGLAVSSLPPAARRIVEEAGFGANYVVKPYGADDEGFDEETMFSMDFKSLIEREMASQKARLDYLMEPTESMPRGIPNDAHIVITDINEKAYVPIMKGEDMDPLAFMGEMGGATEQMLASMLAMSDMMPAEETFGQMPTEVTPVTRHTMTITLRCTNMVGYAEKHREAKPIPDAKTTKISDLGEDFTKLLAKRKEDMKRWKPMFDMGMGMGRRGTPPPMSR